MNNMVRTVNRKMKQYVRINALYKQPDENAEKESLGNQEHVNRNEECL
jgi:hypothetical protein